jgi:hypothetical protein
MPGGDEELAASLKRAKTAKADSPFKFVFVMKGGTDGGLLVSKQKIPPSDIAAVKKSTGGSAVLKGVCFGEDGKLVFEIAKDPAATMAPALKKVIQREANLVYQIVCRKGTNPELAEEAGEPAPPVEKKATVAPRESAAAEWNRRVAELMPRLKQALQVGHPKTVGDLKTWFKLAKNKAKDRDFGQALSRLPTIEQLIEAALAAPYRAAPPTAGSAPQPTEPRAAKKPLVAWQQASKEVAGRVVQLQGVLRETKIPVLREMGDEMMAALRKYVTELSTALLEYEKATDNAKAPARQKAAALVAAYPPQIAAEKALVAADSNPFGVKVASRETLFRSLQSLRQALAVAS